MRGRAWLRVRCWAVCRCLCAMVRAEALQGRGTTATGLGANSEEPAGSGHVLVGWGRADWQWAGSWLGGCTGGGFAPRNRNLEVNKVYAWVRVREERRETKNGRGRSAAAGREAAARTYTRQALC